MLDVIYASEDLSVIVSDPVVEFLQRQRQPRWFANERAGQLFGHIDGATVNVLEATGPRRGERCNHSFYDIDRGAAQKEIDEHYTRGLHFIGDWHTHYQPRPSPSNRDRASMDRLYTSSHHELGFVLMLIVGTAEPEQWWCSAHHSEGFILLPPQSEGQ